MKKIILFFMPFLILAAAGCGKKNVEKENISGQFIERLVNRAISGSSSANDSLGKIINLNFPINTGYNNQKIDSIRSKSGNLYYTVLLEYPNPVYNRFAVYDTLLRTHLIDESLNGNITEDKIIIDGLSFLKVSESFISKDIFNVRRFSLYSVGDSTVSRVFRTFTQLEYDNRNYLQSIDEISALRIKTKMTSNRYSPVMNKSDIFMFNPDSNLYESKSNLFDNYVISVINKSKNRVQKPQLTDDNSVWESVGVDPRTVSTQSTGNKNSGTGFSLTLSEDWKEFRNFNVSEFLNREFKGVRYLNNSIGTSISVFEIPAANFAEDFISYKLEGSAERGKMKIRYTDEIIDGKIFVRFYEFSCGNRKMMIIIKGSRYTYDDYKELYSKIIDTFSMGC